MIGTISNIKAIAAGIKGEVIGDPLASFPVAKSINSGLARRIAQAFDDADPIQEDAILAYRQMAREVHRQFRALQSAGIDFEAFGDDVDDPYGIDSRRMADDLATGHLWVFDGGADHPFLSRQENWMFRAVHDAFGHAMHGFGFGPIGEENAWRCHSLMFSPLARAAMTSETRGQNSWVNFGPWSHLPRRDRPFAQQKGCILPDFCQSIDS